MLVLPEVKLRNRRRYWELKKEAEKIYMYKKMETTDGQSNIRTKYISFIKSTDQLISIIIIIIIIIIITTK